MKKLFKRMAAITMTMVMMFSVLCVNAFAAGTVDGELHGSGTSTYISYSFDVDGNNYSPSNNGAHYGQTSEEGFAVSSKGSYKITFDGIRTKANVYIYNESSDALACSFFIPVYQSGMPTLSYSADLDEGQYYVKVVSSSYDTYSTGGFRVYGISGKYNHAV